jgi:hypothetical protein
MARPASGPASPPAVKRASSSATTPAHIASDSIFANLIETDAQSTAPLAAIALPREAVRAARRAHRRRRAPRLPLGALGRLAGRLVLLTPPLLVLAAALWAAVAGFGSLLQVVRLVVTVQFAQAAAEFPSIDAAGRALLASVGYFALLAALRTLTRGLFSHGWARLRLVLGLLLALPSAWLFAAGAELAAGAPPLTSVSPELARLLVILLLLHAIALAVVTTREPRAPSTATPASRRAVSRRSEWFVEPDEPEAPGVETERLPIVRFGPPAMEEPARETDETDMTDTQAMRVAGLLHMLSARAPDSASVPPATPSGF